MNKKYIFIGILSLIILAIGLSCAKNSKIFAPESTIEFPGDTDPALVNLTKGEALIVKKLNTLPLSIKTKQTQNTLETANEKMYIYETLSIEEASLTTKPRKNITPVGAIRMPSNSMATLTPNDTFTLRDIEGADYTMTISGIQEHDDGSVTKTGQFTDEGIIYTTTITQAEHSSFITLSTPQGLYEIETSNEVGYIYRTDTIRKQMQNTKINDVIVLPIPKVPKP